MVSGIDTGVNRCYPYCAMSRNVTIRDIAEKAGVSFKTVSRILNNEPHVRADKRERVMAVVKSLNYAPNLLARDLSSKVTRTVAFVFLSRQRIFSREYYFTEMFDSAQRELGNRDYAVLFLSPDDVPADPVAYLSQLVRARRLSGLVLADLVQCDYTALDALGVPTVVLSRRALGRRLAGVMPDNAGGLRQAVEHLHSLGHRRIGFFGLCADKPPFAERLSGYAHALRRLGLAADPAWVYSARANFVEAVPDAARAFFSQSPDARPTGLCCASDIMAVALPRECQTRGLRVPQDVSIVSFDDTEIVQMTHPPLTSMHTPRDDMGRRAAQKLIAMIESEEEGEIIEFPVTLTLRGSTGPVPVPVQESAR